MQGQPKKTFQWLKSLSTKSRQGIDKPTARKIKTDEVLGRPPLTLPSEYLEIEFPGLRQGRFQRSGDSFLIHHVR
jgi:hypothetical protein